MRKLLTFDPSHAALLCIDLQEEHRQDIRYLVEGFSGVLANAASLQETARACGIKVLNFAYVVHLADAMRPLHPRTADGISVFSDVSSPWTAICGEVAPADGEEVIVKKNASAFCQPDLKATLRDLGHTWLIVAGVWTEACIAATVKDAVDLGFV
jgi:nicotinamidase-related amidase